MHRPQASWPGIARWLIAIAAAFSLAGCYTMLSHPRTADPTQQEASGSCLACHDDDSFSAGSVPWVGYYSYSSSPWINYYGSPWWYESRWYWDDECRDCPPEDGSDENTLSGRYAWGRRPVGWSKEDAERERTSSALPAIAAPPAAPASPPPVTTEENQDKPDKEKPKEPRRRSLRR